MYPWALLRQENEKNKECFLRVREAFLGEEKAFCNASFGSLSIRRLSSLIVKTFISKKRFQWVPNIAS